MWLRRGVFALRDNLIDSIESRYDDPLEYTDAKR
jgi:hypothetical protein